MSALQDILWSERFRPHTIQDCILPNDLKTRFLSIVEKGEIPNMLLVGCAGIGKTTVARALCDELDIDYIIINGSEESGIDVLRTKVRQFATTISLGGKRKIIIIDEADGLSSSFQPALRGAIEEFSKNCGFILTANYKNRIIPALQSRCTPIIFGIPKDEKQEIGEQLVALSCKILDDNAIEYELAAIVEVVLRFFPDFRRVINELQGLSHGGKITKSLVKHLTDDSMDELFGYLKSKNFRESRKWIGKNSDGDVSNMVRKFYDNFPKYMESGSVLYAILLLNDFMRDAVQCPDMEVALSAFIINLMDDNCQYKS